MVVYTCPRCLYNTIDNIEKHENFSKEVEKGLSKLFYNNRLMVKNSLRESGLL